MIKLPDFSECVQIRELLLNMGVTELPEIGEEHFVIERIEKKIIEVPNDKQLEFASKLRKGSVNIRSSHIEFDTDGLIEVDGVKCCIYIFSQHQGYDVSKKTSTYRYHLCECSTIHQMISDGRKDRYVATRQEESLFEVNVQGHYKKPTLKKLKLELCYNCMSILKSKGIFFTPFTLKAFYEKYQPSLPSTFKKIEEVTITERYAPDHDQIARRYKEKVGYTCQQCKVNCSHDKECLHLHHKNGESADNNHTNLAVLCTACHMAQPSHSHMRANPKFVQQVARINALRRDQNIFSLDW